MCVTLITFLSTHCLMFTSVNDIYFSLAGYDTVKLPDFFLPLLHTYTHRHKGRERDRNERGMPMHSIVFMAILKHPSFAGVWTVVEGSGSSTDGEYTGAE